MSTLITTVTGRANARMALTELFVFFIPVKGKRGEVEDFLGKASKAMRVFPDNPVQSNGQVQVTPSYADMPADIGGNTATASYQVAEGTILKVAMKTNHGGKLKQGCLFLHVRQGAASRCLKVNCVPNNALFVPFFSVTGRFDVIDVDTAKSVGAKINAMSEGLAERTGHIRNRGLYEIETFDEEETAPVSHTSIESEDGTEKLMPVVVRKRKIEKL